MILNIPARGYGPGASIAFVVTRGYSLGVAVVEVSFRILVVPPPVRSVTLIAPRRTVTVPAFAIPTLFRGRAMYPITDMHPTDVRDLEWTLTPLLATGETVSGAVIVITEGNVVAAAPTLVGAVVTSRITANLCAIGEQAIVTCRFTTSLSRRIDVSYYFTIRARFMTLDKFDPDDTDRVTFDWEEVLSAAGSTLIDADAAVDFGGLTLGTVSFIGDESLSVVSGGTLGALAKLRHTATLADGQIENFTLAMPVHHN